MNNTIVRKNGFYWVKYKDSWCICEYQNGIWWWPGITINYQDKDFKEIDETPIVRNADCPTVGRYFEESKPLTDFEQKVLNDTMKRTAKTEPTLPGRK